MERRFVALLFTTILVLASRQAHAADDEFNEPRAGYHVEYRPRRGPLVTGVALGASFYFLAAIGGSVDGYENGKAWLWVPVAGPWMTLAVRETPSCYAAGGTSTSCCREFGCPGSAAAPLLFLDGLGQLSGAILVTVAYAAAKPQWVVDKNVMVAPIVQPQVAGLSLRGAW